MAQGLPLCRFHCIMHVHHVKGHKCLLDRNLQPGFFLALVRHLPVLGQLKNQHRADRAICSVACWPGGWPMAHQALVRQCARWFSQQTAVLIDYEISCGAFQITECIAVLECILGWTSRTSIPIPALDMSYIRFFTTFKFAAVRVLFRSGARRPWTRSTPRADVSFKTRAGNVEWKFQLTCS
eukprot:356191-Chlamydomonas_euryale.AAC.11